MTQLHIPDGVSVERNKYVEMWGHADYKKYSPGLENVERFINVLEPYVGSSILDIGCGAGVAGLQFKALGFSVTWLDLTSAGLDEKIDRKYFIEAPVWSREWADESEWEYGFCCDVMEHLPTEYTMLALHQMVKACKTLWLQIALEPDTMGALIGQPLHLTVRPYKWWLERIATIGHVVDARDLCGMAMFVVQR